jgi:hypothetical protein
MATKFSFNVWTNCQVGGQDISDLIRAVENRGVNITDWTKEIFGQIVPLTPVLTLDLVKVTLRTEGGLPRKSKGRTLRPMYEEAFECGLCLCPPEVSLYLFTKETTEPLGDFRLAMKPVPCQMSGQTEQKQDNLLQVIDTRHQFGSSRVIGASPGALDEFADGGMTYLFCQGTPELLALRLGELPKT